MAGLTTIPFMSWRTMPRTRLRPMRLRHGLAALVMLSILSPMASAQNVHGYKVELILFTELIPSAIDSEHWREDPGQAELQDAISLSIGNDQVQALDSSAYRLSGIWSALKNSKNYRPVRHLAWQQPGLPSRRAPVVVIGDEPEAEILGTAKVSLARFLHLDLDLVLKANDRPYRLKLSRRMRSNELNYVDHPMFGVIAIITPLTE